MLAALGELRRGEAAGKYTFVLPLGQGGTADVYLAVADGPGGFQKLVVLKVLKPALANDDELRRMFLTEARLAARLQHPNIVQTYEVLEDAGTPIIVMEFLDGQPLSQVIVRGKQVHFTLSMQLRVLADALCGLHAAHELADVDGTPLGVVHRDVSPQNLFVTVAGQTKVLDFGIAKVQRSLVETEVGTIKGKLRYMAPEQIAGEKLDHRADVYAAGVILWEALAGERMWRGAEEAEIRARVRSGDLPPPRAPGRDVPAALERICRRALAHSPADRHATAIELADDLEGVLSKLGRAPSHREIGAMVARLFDDARAQSRAAIEGKLGRLAAPAAGVPAPVDRPVTQTIETPVEPAPAAAAERGRRRAQVVALAIAGTLAVVAGATWAGAAFVARHPTTASATTGATTSVTTTIGGAPAVGRTEPPPTAPPVAPTAAAMPEVQAPPDTGGGGLRPVPRPTTRHPRRPAATGDGAAPQAPTQAAPPRPDCTYPFFVDADGIKRFRPECR
jgi:serine/threonine-protein kinase